MTAHSLPVETPAACAPCLRNGREAGVSEGLRDVCGKYLLWHIAEDVNDTAGKEALALSSTEMMLVFNASGQDRTFLGAVIKCAGRIAKGDCDSWQYDASQHTIATKDALDEATIQQ